jgi:hypothetical protein
MDRLIAKINGGRRPIPTKATSGTEYSRTLDELNTTFSFFDKRSVESAVDGLRYNQTLGYPYASRFYEMIFMLQYAMVHEILNENTIVTWFDMIMEAHYENVLYELECPPIDYSIKRSKPKALRDPSRPRTKRKAEPSERSIRSAITLTKGVGFFLKLPDNNETKTKE